jgi:hypothetical protein
VIRALISALYFGVAVRVGMYWWGLYDFAAFGWYMLSVGSFAFGLYALKRFWKAP